MGIIRRLLKKLFEDVDFNESTSKKKQETKNPPQTEKNYYKKESLITESEKKYFHAIKRIIGEQYILQPQINLASIVEKTKKHKYQNELYRNIDFGIFTPDYQLIALIEINDNTHNTQKRKARDHKVKDICEQAEIPLITFWTKYGVNEDYIEKRIKEVI